MLFKINSNTMGLKDDAIHGSLAKVLPADKEEIFAPVGKCIYCGATTNLSTEHIIPFGLGGKKELLQSSCLDCARITGMFERTCLRSMYGPLRILYDLPSRRKAERPQQMDLKVKEFPSSEIIFRKVNTTEFPFIVLFPYIGQPKILMAQKAPCIGAKVKRIWIRGAAPYYDFHKLLKKLSRKLRVSYIEPQGKLQVSEFFRMLAKIAHSYTVSQLGNDSFIPFLIPCIKDGFLDNSDLYIGSLDDEPPSDNLHELSLKIENGMIIVRIRLLAKLGTPTYIVVAGKIKSPQR